MDLLSLLGQVHENTSLFNKNQLNFSGCFSFTMGLLSYRGVNGFPDNFPIQQ